MMQNRFSEGIGKQAVTLSMDRAAESFGVVVVSYNSRALLRDCLASLISEPWERVIVVDNVSSDGSAEMVREDFPWVKLIVSRKNDGYGAAANLAIAQCPSKYVLLLNSDTRLQPGTLRALSDHLDRHPKAAVAGPKLVHRDGTWQNSCFEFPAPFQTLLRETSLSRLARLPSRFARAEFTDESTQVARVVPWVLGAALAIRRAAFEAVDGFDESFFMYFEEVDLCYRLGQAGWQTHFVPQARVMHVGGASTERHRAAMLRQLYKSLCHFYQQHYSGRQRFQLKLIITYLMLRNIVKDSLRLYHATHYDAADNLSVWRSVLSNVWSPHGWLKA